MPKCRYVAKVVPHWPDLGGNFCNKACWSHLGKKKTQKILSFFVFFGADVKVIPRKKADHIEDNGVPSRFIHGSIVQSNRRYSQN